ncbi:DUF502 domain-containing protein [bacterium]|nr:DUF502 domain-containing protein [bacterium]
MLSKLRKIFITGLLVLTPIVLTVYILYISFRFFDGLLKNVVSQFLTDTFGISQTITSIPGLGLLVLLALVLLTGSLARNFIGRKLFDISDFIVTRIPLANRIYIAIQEISEALLSEKREIFKNAVLIEYPRKGLYTMAFFTQDTRGPIQDTLQEDVVSVFVPTSPNPTSGYLLFVPKTQVTDLDMSVEDAMKLVISGGSVHLKERNAFPIKQQRKRENKTKSSPSTPN